MARVPLTIVAPAHDSAVVTGASVSLHGEGPPPPAGAALQYRWWSSLPTVPPRPDPGDPPDLDLVAVATSLQASVSLSVGSHIISLSAKDVVGDDPDDLAAVREAGTAGGAPPDAETPCVVHVAGAIPLLPADRRISRAIGAAAQAPPVWDQEPYQAVNALRYRWAFQPQPADGRQPVVVEPDPGALAFAPGSDQPEPFMPPPPVPPRVLTGALPATLSGGYTLTLTVSARGAQQQATSSVTVVG